MFTNTNTKPAGLPGLPELASFLKGWCRPGCPTPVEYEGFLGVVTATAQAGGQVLYDVAPPAGLVTFVARKQIGLEEAAEYIRQQINLARFAAPAPTTPEEDFLTRRMGLDPTTAAMAAAEYRSRR